MTTRRIGFTRPSLRDYATEPGRLAVLSLVGIAVGGLAGVIAFGLLRLIGLITNLAYRGRLDTGLTSPDPTHLGLASVLLPVMGGLMVGLMARYGTDKIRGHGIPEALQSILEGGACIEPRVAVLKPVSAAVTIGTGGPFGAEGPIIMTGGAVGSIVAQALSLSAAERRTLLVAGAAGGMAATFGSPIAAVFLAVELLLFEWRPRSFVPVALASLSAYGVRAVWIGTQAVFGGATSSLPLPMLPVALGLGVVAGVGSVVVTRVVYAVEDAYRRLPVHWMWWPAIGGLFVGLGGLVLPSALGVGYPVIRAFANGHVTLAFAATFLIVKALVWVLALGSGTSGGVLAPLLLIGGALGTLVGGVLPGSHGAWAIVGMASLLGATMRAPFTATVFAMETTHDWALVLPVFLASVVGTAVTVVLLPRSILTEKVARRGTHVAREYGVHPLEGVGVRDILVPWAEVETVPATRSIGAFAAELARDIARTHYAYPVLDGSGLPIGVALRSEVLSLAQDDERRGDPVAALTRPAAVVGAHERARSAVERMARSGDRHVLVVDHEGAPVGFLTQADLLKAWARHLEEEETRRRVLPLPVPGGRRRAS
jgi:CIC family chloride channel protein